MEVQSRSKPKKHLWLNQCKPISKQTEQALLENCICHRKRGLITCKCCLKSFMGRIGERCPAHPEIAYLMDARNCAFCGANAYHLQMADQT